MKKILGILLISLLFGREETDNNLGSGYKLFGEDILTKYKQTELELKYQNKVKK